MPKWTLFTRGVLVLALALVATTLTCQAATVSFPAGLIPFSSLDYRTLSDSNGYSLVLGEMPLTSLAALEKIAAPVGSNEYFSGPVELAPGYFFNGVMVPTVAELQGDYQDFGGPIYDPLTFAPSTLPVQFAVDYSLQPGFYQPFVGNYIPEDLLLGGFFAFRIGPDAPASAPEPAALLLFALGSAALACNRVRRRTSN